MKVLTITNMYPEPARPAWGAFVKSQVDSLKREGVETDVLVIQGRRTKISYLTAILRMWVMLCKTRYDLIHAHYGLSGLVARFQWCCPVVVSFCGSDLYGNSDTEGNPTPGSFFLARIHKKLARWVHGVIVKSPAMANLIPRAKPQVIPNGIFMDIFKPMDKAPCRTELGLKEGVTYILFPYAIDNARKNHPLVEKVAQDLRDRYAMDVEIAVVEKAPHEEMARYMNATDVLVLVSFWEGSPNVVKEAMACDMPIVSVDVGDVVDLLSGVPGCLVVDRETGPVADAVVSVLQSAKESPGARRKAIEHLDAPVVAQRVIGVYESTLKKAHPSPSP